MSWSCGRISRRATLPSKISANALRRNDSSNFDDRSFETNDEITLGIRDATLARSFEEIFERDCRLCTELELSSWQARGLWHRLGDNVLHAFNEVL